MIPLIDCSDSDAERYYRGVLVFLKDTPVIFHSKRGSNATILVNGRPHDVHYDALRITVLDPFYDHRGEYYGHSANRRTSRGIGYHPYHMDDVVDMLRTGDVPRRDYDDGFRLNKDFRIKRNRGVDILLYRGDTVGFKVDDTYYVYNLFMLERLEKLNVSVQQIPQD